MDAFPSAIGVFSNAITQLEDGKAIKQLSTDQIAQVLNTIRVLKSKGYREDHPEITRLLILLKNHSNLSERIAQQQNRFQDSKQPEDKMEASKLSILAPNGVGTLNPSQIQQLQAQVSAYRHISQNSKIPDSLQSGVLGMPVNGANLPSAQQIPSIVQNTLNIASSQVRDKVARIAKASDKHLDPYSFLNNFIDTDHAKRLLIPAILPQGIDPYLLVEEREKQLHARIQARMRILESLPTNLPHALKIKALIELKSLRLLEKQRQLRRDLAHFVDRALRLESENDSRSIYRRLKKQTLREARLSEKMERQFRLEKEKRERQRHQDFLQSVLNHARELKEAQRLAQQKISRLGRSILQLHTNIERDEQRRVERVEKDRLRALRADDEEAYMKLIDQAKDSRLVHLLRQTDDYLKMLGSLVQEQKRSNISVDDDPSLLLPALSDSSHMSDEVRKHAADDDKLQFYEIAHSIQENVTVQPSLLIGGTLKEYQLRGLQWMVSLYNNYLNGILADEMGLGKTIQTISLITYLMDMKKQNGPFLVIVPLSTLTNWVMEFEKWAPSVVKIVYKGVPSHRKSIYQTQIRNAKFNVLLTTYEYVIRDKGALSKIKWTYLIIDEGHRMKNAHCKLTQTLTQYYTCRHRLLLSGTPLQNSLPELWALLNFLLPKIFNSCRNFEDWFNTPFANTGEMMELNEEEKLLVIKRLHKVLRPFLLRRLKKDVESELPDKVERIIKCEMSALQKRLYDQVKQRGLQQVANPADAQRGKRIFGSLNNTIMQLRKICNHPFIFDPVERVMDPNRTSTDLLVRVSGKFELLNRMLPKMKATGHKVLVFFQMTQIMTIMEDYCQYKGLMYLRLDGATKAEDRTALLKAFNAPNSPYFMFLLSTRAGGLGLNLQTADTVIIFDSDWNPHQDLQAQDRAHRIGQTKEVRVYRLITIDSIEEYILTRAQYKLDVDEKVIQAGKFDQKTSAEEREALLRNLFDEDEKQEENEVFDDEELNEVIARNEDELELYKKMDIEREKERLRIWQKLQLSSKFPARLLEESELPKEFALPDENEDDLTEEDLERRREEELALPRQRKVVSYAETMSDAKWARMVDSGLTPEEIVEKDRLRKQKRQDKAAKKAGKSQRDEFPDKRKVQARRSVTDEDHSDMDELNDENDDSEKSEQDEEEFDELSAQDQGAEDQLSDNDQENELEDSASSLNGRNRKTNAGQKVNAFPFADGDDVIKVENDGISIINDVQQQCRNLIERLVSERNEEGELRTELFVTLPSKRDYPDYYEMIQKPIALDKIQKKIASNQYNSLQACLDDLDCMFQNAKFYNVEESEVYQDAVALEKISRDYVSEAQRPVKLTFKIKSSEKRRKIDE